jgi:hypothetical protein
MRLYKLAASFGAVAVVSIGLAVPASGAGASSPWYPPVHTTTTYVSHCAQLNVFTPTGEPLTISETTTQVTRPWSSTPLIVGMAKVSGGPNGKTLSLRLSYTLFPSESSNPIVYSGWAVIGDAGVLGFSNPTPGGVIYLEGGTGSVDHYGDVSIQSGQYLDVCSALGYP